MIFPMQNFISLVMDLNIKKLRIYISESSSNSNIGASVLHGVSWKGLKDGAIENPFGSWTGTQRVLRDNHYAEALENLGKRSFSTPDRRYSTVGFRLVQRP